MHALRKQILEILKEQSKGATVAELAEQLEMAPVSVRHHLDILQGDNLICVDRLERKGSVGRPQQIYVLTEEAIAHFPNNFAVLAGKLVGQIKQLLPPEQIPCAFRAMAQEMAAECDGLYADMPMAARLEQITEFLNDHGYLARWEAVEEEAVTEDDDGTEILLETAHQHEYRAKNGVAVGDLFIHKYNCPYAGISDEHSELCLMDKALIDELTGCACERVASMAEGSPCCTYRVNVQPETVTLSVPHSDRRSLKLVQLQ
ncbi:MAG TPA: ArsR family transcriptional regulator [Caldilineaceae bacterium]|nr:ArsR family transcriptional regulator [Caldilineaceae bacterium]